MTTTLYFSRNPNPRLAVAVARWLKAPVVFEWAAPLAPDQQARFLPLNPNLRIPILVEGGQSLWETDAIACWLSLMCGARLWRMDDALPDMIRWISWAHANFVRACDMVHFERGTKRRYNLGPTDPALIEEGLANFHEGARILDAHLAGRDWLLGSEISYADLRMATFLPYNNVAQLPLTDYPAVARWYARLDSHAAWADPFAGLEAPELPPIRPHAAG